MSTRTIYKLLKLRLGDRERLHGFPELGAYGSAHHGRREVANFDFCIDAEWYLNIDLRHLRPHILETVEELKQEIWPKPCC